jgi:AcrR family transcriptional regulator
VIVATAVSLADSEGLEAVSIRRVAAALDARPMSIYSFAAIDRKEELMDLMVDDVCAELLLPEGLPQHWRDALHAVAVRTRAVLVRHPWWIELIGRHTLVGPNGMRYREQTLAAVADLEIDVSLKMALVTAVETYTVGQAALAVDTTGPVARQSRSCQDQRQADRSYQQTLISTGEFPHLARIGSAWPEAPADRERFFLLGLDWLLSGAKAALADSGRRPSTR